MLTLGPSRRRGIGGKPQRASVLRGILQAFTGASCFIPRCDDVDIARRADAGRRLPGQRSMLVPAGGSGRNDTNGRSRTRFANPCIGPKVAQAQDGGDQSQSPRMLALVFDGHGECLVLGEEALLWYEGVATDQDPEGRSRADVAHPVAVRAPRRANPRLPPLGVVGESQRDHLVRLPCVAPGVNEQQKGAAEHPATPIPVQKQRRSEERERESTWSSADPEERPSARVRGGAGCHHQPASPVRPCSSRRRFLAAGRRVVFALDAEGSHTVVEDAPSAVVLMREGGAVRCEIGGVVKQLAR